ncbi:MAG TPA: type II toxin-antitoxin system HicB family antitoxin [Planctomycetota bacterium]
MISRYLGEALRRARYVAMPGGYTATVRGLRGVIALARTQAACRAQLSEVVEEWVLVRVARGLPIPRLGRAQIRVRRAS